MNLETLFVGDVHGEFDAISQLLHLAAKRGYRKVVLLGDYINKGPSGAQVIELLTSYTGEPTLVPLLGNHEEVFLRTLQSGDVRPLLRMSGAPTIRSYVGRSVGPAVFEELIQAVPPKHLDFLLSLTSEYVCDGVVASHQGGTVADAFRVSAHVPAGLLPTISLRNASIDTGCGTPGGRLTGFSWPSCRFFQVNAKGLVHEG